MRKLPIRLTGVPADDLAILLARIDERRHEETRELCSMLAALGVPAAGEALRRLCVHEDQNVRAAAVAALGPFLGDAAATTSLRHALGDPRPMVVQAALRVVRAHDPAAFRPELRALAAMPNEDAGEAWLAVADDALVALAACCTAEDRDLGVRACADPKLERGGGALLEGLFRRLRVDELVAFAAGRAPLCAQALPRLMDASGAARLAELAACGVEPLSREAARVLELYRTRTELRPVPAERRCAVADVRPQVNDGSESIAYVFSTDDGLNRRLSALLNDACHVFRHHAQGTWPQDKERYAEQLRAELRVNPWLIRRLLALKDRVVASVLYRAMRAEDER